MTVYPYVWWWRVKLPERRGQRCRIRCRGALNSVAVEFEDGECHLTVRNCVEPVGDEYREPAVQGNLF